MTDESTWDVLLVYIQAVRASSTNTLGDTGKNSGIAYWKDSVITRVGSVNES